MRRAPQKLVLALSAALVTGFGATHAFAQEPAEDPVKPDADAASAQGKAEGQVGVAPAEQTEKPSAAPATQPPAPAAEPEEKPANKPKVGDTTVSGYFRGGFGATVQRTGVATTDPMTGETVPAPHVGGRMTCFALSDPSGLKFKYRLGNECEVWGETHFKMVTYAGSDGVVANLHFMPAVYIPTSFIGHSSTGLTSAPDQNMTSTGATVSFPNLYLDIENIPWLFGGTAWAGTRYYKRESVYINDFFYWNPSGVGGGVEDIHLGKDLRLSYGIFAVDGVPTSTGVAPPLPLQVDLGFRNDVQLRGIKPYKSGEIQLGFQGIIDYSDHKDANGDSVTHGGWGATVQFVQELLGGNNKLAFQYGKGGGTGFGTLARFYYPDFALWHDPSESRIRLVDVLTIQPVEWLGGQATFIYQHDDLNQQGTSDWISAGARVTWAPLKYAKLIGEVGYDHVKKSVNSDPQMLTKFTIAPALTTDRGFMARPEIRIFYTWAMWNDAARNLRIDSGNIYLPTNFLSGATFGLQGETWF
jgi:maltoporin